MGPAMLSFVLSLFIATHTVDAGDNGIIGFGLSLYQDQCCQACFDSLSALYLTCTTFSDDVSMDMSMSMDMGDTPMGMTSDECYATNTPWLQTMAYCIRSNCDAHGYPADKQPACFSAHAVAGASPPTFEDSLPSVAPTVELAADAMWLNITSLVNADTYYATYGTEAEFARSEYLHTRYSVILYLITIGFIIGAGLLAQARAFLPGFQKSLSTSSAWARFQQYLFLPALFGSRRMQPLPKHIGYVPGRALSIFITLYVIMNVVLCSVSFRSFQPNIFWASVQMELCEYVGNRTGTLSLVNMSMAILFAGRNNLLILLTGWTQSTFLTLHRWSAGIATLQAIVHSIVYTLQYFVPPTGGAVAYAAKVKETFYWVGIIATVAMSLAVAHAILPFRMGAYETFLLIHIALVIITLVTTWYHLVPHFGFIYGYQVWLYISFAFWFFDRLVRVGRIVYFNRIGMSSAIVEAIPGCDVLQVTFFPRVWKFGPGQHSFLYLPDSSLYLPGIGAKFWENHPFSVAGWKRQGDSLLVAPMYTSISDDISDSEIKKIDSPVVRQRSEISQQSLIQDHTSIQFLIRVHSGMTATLQRRVLASPSRAVEISMYAEGPYAGHKATLSPLSNAETVLLIVGGIGITTALGFVQQYVDAQKGQSTRKKNRIMQRTTRFILAWSAKELSLIEHVKSHFLTPIDQVAGVEYLLWCTEDHGLHDEPAKTTEGVTHQRMNIRSVMRSVVEPGVQMAVMVCGPGGMIDETTREVVSCIQDGLRVDMMEEAFGW